MAKPRREKEPLPEGTPELGPGSPAPARSAEEGKRSPGTGGTGKKEKGKLTITATTTTPGSPPSATAARGGKEGSPSSSSSASSPNQQQKPTATPVEAGGGRSPVVSVPLIVPRYQRKSRQFNEMTLTDTAKSASEPISATEALRQRSKEALMIRSGRVRYNEEVEYQAYAMYRFGKSRYHTQSVGYSSEGELVLQKEEISSEAEGSSDPNLLQRRAVEVTGAVCLDPYAKRAQTDDEMTARRKVNASRLKKFPGVKAPKNKKIRNRLKNDFMASEYARQVYIRSRHHLENEDDDDELTGAASPSFPSHEAMKELLHKEEAEVEAVLEKKGISPTLKAQTPERHPDSPEYRFHQLSSRLRDELKRAVKSETLTKVMLDLEAKFTAYITSDDFTSPDVQPLELVLHDSYCRLVCHGVATYYRLNSRSEEMEDPPEPGQKKTIITRPAKADVELPIQTLVSFLLKKPALEPFSLDAPPAEGDLPGGMMLPPATDEPMTKTQKKKLKKMTKMLQEPQQGDIPTQPSHRPKKKLKGARRGPAKARDGTSPEPLESEEEGSSASSKGTSPMEQPMEALAILHLQPLGVGSEAPPKRAAIPHVPSGDSPPDTPDTHAPSSPPFGGPRK